jgi:hypothetical protein
LTPPATTASSLKLLHIRKSGPDVAGSMEDRGKMFGSPDQSDEISNMEDEDDDDDDDMEDEDEDEGMHINEGRDLPGTNIQNSDDPGPTGTMGAKLSIRPSALRSKSSNDEAETGSNIEVADDANPDSYEDYLANSKLAEAPQSLLKFDHWAFGAEGIPSLQVLAYGDFSFEGRFDYPRLLLCREEWQAWRNPKDNSDNSGARTLPFRPIRPSDVKMRELIRENMDFLEACPADTIFIKE